jgi:RNA polymerase sigma-70 factor (ECF subfamily)
VTRRRGAPTFLSLDELEAVSDGVDHEQQAGNRLALDQLIALIHKLDPLERQVISLYLEGLDGATIGDITGISAGNVATKVHRIKNVLRRQFQRGAP